MEKLNILKKAFKTTALTVCALSLWACSAEDPFHVENEGTSLVRLNVNLNNSVTRSESSSYNEDCAIYISNENGLLHKWIGVSNLPASGVYLRYGNYLAEAIVGDSVPASFIDKFLRGATRFEVSQNQISTQVSIDCKLANVVTSIDVSDLSSEIRNSIKVVVESTTGQLIFEDGTLSAKGYFMRYYDESKGEYDSELKYTVSGKDIDGTTFSKTGVISDVVPAHEYRIVISSGGQVDPIGGASLKILVKEYELEVDDTVIIHGKPEFSWANNEIDLDKQLYNKDKAFTDKKLFIAAYEKFESLVLYTESDYLKNSLGGLSQIDFVSSEASEKEKLKGLGVEIEDGQKGLYQQFSVNFTSDWLNKLESSVNEYVLNLVATDKRGMKNNMQIRIATSEEALDAPFALNLDYNANNYLSIKAHSAELAVNLYDKVDDLQVRYKPVNDSEWIYQTLELNTRAGSQVFNLTGLKPNTTYQCQLVSGISEVEKFQFESAIETFKTEDEFIIPNASMDNWWLNSKVWMPNLDAASEFWDSGNHGATLIGSEEDNLTTKFTGFSHTSGACAKLQSKFVGVGTLGKLGSGNIFVGKYAGTSGTNGKIDFGREYNGSHPSKLRVWVNYRPAKAVSRKGANDSYIKEGEYDKGQIYIAISDAIKSVDTSNSSTLVTEERAPELFLAYGQHTFEGDFAEDNEMQMVEIPFNYYDKAKTISPKYLIIVCCASKYGDYFSGGDGSVMYVDDFELVYE